jgi:hypothetical protein
MPFTIVCPLCGYDEQGSPVSYFRDAINNEAWIPYAKHILDKHQDNFRVHWAEHALSDKNLAYTPIKQVIHELATPKIQSMVESQVLASGVKSKPNEQTITDFLLRHKQEVEDAQKIVKKPKLSPAIVAKVKERLAKKKASELIPEDKAENTQVPEYEQEEENPFQEQIDKLKRN